MNKQKIHTVFQGMSIAILGPTFQDLAANVNKNVSDIYYIFMGRSLGYLGGSVIGGIIFDCMNPHLLLGKCTQNNNLLYVTNV